MGRPAPLCADTHPAAKRNGERWRVSEMENDRPSVSKRYRIVHDAFVVIHVVVSLAVGFAVYFNRLSTAHCDESGRCDYVLLYWTMTGIWSLAVVTFAAVIVGGVYLRSRRRPYLWVPVAGTFLMLGTFALALFLDAVAMRIVGQG